MDLICAMWIAPERGKLDWSMIQFQNFLGVKQSEANSLWHELTSSGVADMKADKKTHRVTVMSRRMLREENQRNQARLRQSRKRHADNSDSSRLIYQKSEVRSHIKNKIPPSLEGIKSSQLLSDMIFHNNPNRTAPTKAILMQWAFEADRINRIDKHEWKEIQELLEWSQRDPFWKTNILSMAKFRKQWNQLSMQKEKGHGKQKGSQGIESLKSWGKRVPKP